MCLAMRDIPVSEKHRGIKYSGIIYRSFVKYRGVPSGGINDQINTLPTTHALPSQHLLKPHNPGQHSLVILPG